MAKLPRNSAPGYGSASVFASVFTGRSPIFARIWRVSRIDGQLKVYGLDNLRIADGSVLPRVTTGNTMAPCVIIGERAADMVTLAHKL